MDNMTLLQAIAFARSRGVLLPGITLLLEEACAENGDQKSKKGNSKDGKSAQRIQAQRKFKLS